MLDINHLNIFEDLCIIKDDKSIKTETNLSIFKPNTDFLCYRKTANEPAVIDNTKRREKAKKERMKRNLTEAIQKTAQGFTGTTPDDLNKEEEILRSLEQLPGSNVSTVIDAPTELSPAGSRIKVLSPDELKQAEEAVPNLTKRLNARTEQRFVPPASQKLDGSNNPIDMNPIDMSLYGD